MDLLEWIDLRKCEFAEVTSSEFGRNSDGNFGWKLFGLSFDLIGLGESRINE